jgi:hypothetical protein
MLRRPDLLLDDDGGATAAEFVLVLPLLLMVIFGILDIAGYAWNMNMAQKATQFGARQAAVTDPVAPGLATQDYVGQVVNGVTLGQGDVIPKEALGLITCTSSSCAATTTPAPTPGFNAYAFNQILNRMQGIDPAIQAGNVTIEYRGSGLGYAGDPSGMQISPLITVRISGTQQTPWQYMPWMGMIFGAAVPMPQASYTLTMEDGAGTQSN